MDAMQQHYWVVVILERELFFLELKGWIGSIDSIDLNPVMLGAVGEPLVIADALIQRI